MTRRPPALTDRQQRANIAMANWAPKILRAKNDAELAEFTAAAKAERNAILEVKPRKVSTAAPIPTEHEEQCAVISWWMHACKLYKLPKFALYSVPNGANRESKVNAQGVRYNPLTQWLQAEGMRNGAPDLVLDFASVGYFGLRIEMKRRKGGVHEPEQKEFMYYLNGAGYMYALCHGADEAIAVIKNYLR